MFHMTFIYLFCLCDCLCVCARALIHYWHTQNSVDSDLMQTAANHVRCINTDQFEDF